MSQNFSRPPEAPCKEFCLSPSPLKKRCSNSKNCQSETKNRSSMRRTTINHHQPVKKNQNNHGAMHLCDVYQREKNEMAEGCTNAPQIESKMDQPIELWKIEWKFATVTKPGESLCTGIKKNFAHVFGNRFEPKNVAINFQPVIEVIKDVEQKAGVKEGV